MDVLDFSTLGFSGLNAAPYQARVTLALLGGERKGDNMRQLVVVGAGGFGQEAIWVAESMNEGLSAASRWEILGYLDDNPESKGSEFYGYRVLGKPGDGVRAGKETWYYCAVGKNPARERLAARLDELGWRAATLVHPSVIQAKYVEIGEGTYVGAGSILSPNAAIGRHVIINQRVSIGHDAVLEDFSQACPGAQINGACKVLRGALVGSNASIHQGRTVGAFAVVGANSQVVRNVDAQTSVCGVPAKRLVEARE
jgi:sugar O-acyltransferase (sialic acid O-acetyltransferase NeuD family)